MTFNVDGYSIGGGVVTLVNNGTTDPNIAVTNATDTATITSVLADAGLGVGFTKSGPGTLFLNNNTGGSTAANTYTGKTIISGGTLLIRADSSLGAAPAAPTADEITINDGATLKLNGKFDITGGNRGVTIHGDATITTNAAGSSKFNPNITGDGRLIKDGPSDLSLRGTNAFTGGLWIKQGSVSSGTVGTNFPSVFPTLRLDTGTIMDLNKVNITVGRLTGTGKITQYGTNVMRTVQIGNGGVSDQFDGNFATDGTGRVSVEKIGSGIYTLTGSIAGSTFDSRIVVSGGNLVLKNTVAIGNWHVYYPATGVLDVSDYATFTVKTGEILAGLSTGSVVGNVLVNGYASPGAGLITGTTLSGGIGTLNVDDIAFGTGGTYYAELTGGSASDLLNVTGDLALNSGTLNAVFRSFTPTSADFGTTWNILDWVPGHKTGTWGTVTLPDVSAIGGNWNTSNLDTDGTVTLVAIPEPAALAMLFMALAAMGGWTIVRRQRSK